MAEELPRNMTSRRVMCPISNYFPPLFCHVRLKKMSDSVLSGVIEFLGKQAIFIMLKTQGFFCIFIHVFLKRVNLM